MSGLQGGSPKNLVAVYGSFDDDLGTIRGHGFHVTVSSGVYTITLDRAYDALVSVTANVLNVSPAGSESMIAVIKSHSVTNGTSGGTVVLHAVDIAGAVQTTPTDPSEIHFCIVLEEDTAVYGYDEV